MGKKQLRIFLPILAILAVVIIYTAVSQNQPNPQPADPPSDPPAPVKEQPRETEPPAKPTMLELGSEGCIPCEKMKPIMAQLKEEHGELIHIEFHDVRKNREIAGKYGIRLIPTQVFLRADGTEFFRHEGYFTKEEIEKVFRDMGVPL